MKLAPRRGSTFTVSFQPSNNGTLTMLGFPKRESALIQEDSHIFSFYVNFLIICSDNHSCTPKKKKSFFWGKNCDQL